MCLCKYMLTSTLCPKNIPCKVKEVDILTRGILPFVYQEIVQSL